MQIRPIGDQVIIRPDRQDMTPAGLVLPDSAKERPGKGTVIAVGPGHLRPDGTLTEMQVKPGDVVAFRRYAGRVLEADHLDYFIMREEAILCVIEPA